MYKDVFYTNAFILALIHSTPIFEYINLSLIKYIVNGAIGLLVNALRHVEKEQEQIPDHQKS